MTPNRNGLRPSRIHVPPSPRHHLPNTATAGGVSARWATYAIDDNLGYLVNRAARLMAQMFSRRLQRHGVALAQWATLLFLYATDGLTQRELSRVVAIEPPTVARTIDRMVRDGLVRREPHRRDGRATRIRLTPRALREELVAESMAGNELAARVLSAEELETLKALLRRVIEGLTEREAVP